MIVWTDPEPADAPTTGPLPFLAALAYLVAVLVAAPTLTVYAGLSPGWAFPLAVVLTAPWVAVAWVRGWGL